MKRLKNGEIEQIFLRDRYLLKIDSDRKIFLSRGGKKRYYLTNAFIGSITDECNEKDRINNIYFQEVMLMLTELVSNQKLGLKTKYTLINIITLMNSII